MNSFLFKIAVLGVLWLALLIPLSQLRSVVTERTGFASGVVDEIGHAWGGQQLVAGPFLVVPVAVPRPLPTKDGSSGSEGQNAVRYDYESITFLPKELTVEGSIATEIRRRGIFEAAVYRADLDLRGSFEPPDISSLRLVDGSEVMWRDAALSFAVSDLRGLRAGLELDWNGRKLELAPLPAGSGGCLEQPILGAKVALAGIGGTGQPAGGPYHFALSTNVGGSGRLSFLPLGSDTSVALLSTWDTPSFSGAFLPDQRTLDKTGFRANWSIPYFARSFPQAFTGCQNAELFAAAFGVDLLLPVDTYQKTDRALKYGGLFVLLTFLTFLLFEIFDGRRLHAIQYLLVGFAMSLFYLLLLSLGEHLPFRLAYLIAAIAVTLLISGYARAILGSRRGSAWLLAVLTLLYAFLCVLLESEDYALLVGSLALFGVLALVMYLTRHVDWTGARPASRLGEPPGADPQVGRAA